METIGFILGRETEICRAEVFSYLEKIGAKYTPILNTREVVIVEKNGPEIAQNELGGTKKLFRVLGEEIPKEKLFNFIKNNAEIAQFEKRINFGISGYGNIRTNEIYKIGKEIKNIFSAENNPSRFVTGKYPDLSTVIVGENKLLERGFEIILIESKGKFFVGQTISVQDYKAYSKRDYGRTARDEKSGMLPPKLAQMLINLSANNTDAVLYDPFCGSGTILQEAVLMGYEKVIGSDASPRAIADTRENLEWLEGRQGFKLPKSVSVFESNITKPVKEIKADAIVTEGYLGEPVRRDIGKAKTDAAKLGSFYVEALLKIKSMLNKNGCVVIAVPFFIVGREKVFLPIESKIESSGFEKKTIDCVKMTERGSLLYARPDSFVGREIFILKISSHLQD